jgi:hypothetical protein
MDPVHAYTAMVSALPTRHPSDPLLTLPGGRPVTARQLQQALRTLLRALGYPAGEYSMHSFRRGGATTSAQAGTDYLHIQRHGGWRSDAFWGYIASRLNEQSPVATALASVVKDA